MNRELGRGRGHTAMVTDNTENTTKTNLMAIQRVVSTTTWHTYVPQHYNAHKYLIVIILIAPTMLTMHVVVTILTATVLVTTTTTTILKGIVRFNPEHTYVHCSKGDDRNVDRDV